MTPALAIELVRHGVVVSLMVAGPLLATALLVGVTVSLVQAITQLQEQTLTFIPKLLAVGLVLIVSLPWLVVKLTEFLVSILNSLPTLVT